MEIVEEAIKENINVVFIGHVNSGKSTLSGTILYISGMVDQRSIEKFERETDGVWDKSHVTDTDEEEREKGITVDVGRGHFNTQTKRYTLLDAPGHKSLVPNMINGVAQADVAILVVSARRGEFESGFEKFGQTREHALLAKTLGVKKLIVVINKMDDITVNWCQDRYEHIKLDIGNYLKTIGWTDITYLPISGLNEINIRYTLNKDICAWYDGKPLFDILDNLKPFENLNSKPLRIPILDKYKDEGKIVIMGKVETGVLKCGDNIMINPNNIKMTVYQIYNDIGIIPVANPGENVKIIVKMDASQSFGKGSVVSHMDNASIVSKDIVVKLYILDLLPHKPLFTSSYECVIHIGPCVEEIKVVRLLEQVDNKGNSIKRNPPFVKNKSFVIAHMIINKYICVEKFTDFEQLGRFTLRDEGHTIGFGKILATNAPIAVKRNKI